MYIDLLVLIFASNRHSMSKEKIKNALNRYYKAFDYDEGTLAYKRGGQMGFVKKHPWGGPNGTTWISEIDQTPVDESFIYDANGQISGLGTDYYIRQYWNQHPEEYFKMQGIDDSIIADWSSKQNGSGFGKVSGSDITKGITQAGTTLKNFGKSDPTLGKNVNMSTPWSAIAGTAGSLTVDLQRAIDSYIRSKDKHVYNPMHSAGLYKKGGNKFEGGGFSSNPMDIGNSFLKIASNAVHQGSLTTDYDTFEDALERYENNQINALNNISDNDALMMAYANHGALSPDDIRARDFRDKTVLGDITDGLASSFEGFNSTGNWIGAVVGGVASNVGSIVGRVRAAKAARKAQEATAIANKDWDSRYFHAVQDVDKMNDTRRLIGFYNNPFDYAYGGEMRTHGADFNNGLTFINEGGTHEENPYEGVPSGVDDEGVPNLVEEGEVIWNNEYVFSNRIKIPKHLAKKYKLGGDLTFADAIKKVTKESLTRPNDPISNETNKAIVNEFMDEQEALREKEQQNAARQLQTAYDDDFMEQMEMMNAAQQMSPIQEAVNYQDPTIAQEGMPIGFAGGGRKGVPKHPSVPYDIYIPDDTNNPASVADRTKKFADVLASYSKLMQVVGDIPGYYKYSVPGREVLEKAYQPYNESAREHTRLMLLRQAAEAEKQLNNTKALGGNKFVGGGGKDNPDDIIIRRPNGKFAVMGSGVPGSPEEYDNLQDARKAARIVIKSIAVPTSTEGNTSTTRSAVKIDPKDAIMVTETGKFRVLGSEGPEEYDNYADAFRAAKKVVRGINSGKPIYGRQATNTVSDIIEDVPIATNQATAGTSSLDNPIEYVYSRDGSQFLGYRIKGQKRRYGTYEAAVNALPEKERAKITIQQATSPQSSESPSVISRDIPDYQAQMLAGLDAIMNNPTYYGERPAQGANSGDEIIDGIRILRYPDGGIEGYEVLATGNKYTNYIEASREVRRNILGEEDRAFRAPTTRNLNNVRTNGILATVPPPDENINEDTVQQEEEEVPVQKPPYSGRTGSKKDTRARDAENSPQYKSLVESMDKASDEDKKKFIDELNAGLPEGKKIKDYSTWRKKATDGAWGSIHEVTVDYINRQPVESAPSQPTVSDSATTQTQDPNPFKNPVTRTVAQLILDGTLKVPQIPSQGNASTVQEQPASSDGSKNNPTASRYMSGIDLARLAPIYGTGIMAANSIARGPIYDNADAIIEAARRAGVPVNIPVQTIGDYMTYKPFDERYLVNMANQNRAAATRGIVNTSNGNRAMDILGNMALAHSNQQELGEIARQAYLANQQQRSAVAEFNRGTNVQNMSAINSRNLTQAQLNSQRQAAALSGIARGYGLRQEIWKDWRDDRDANIEAFLDNIGTWGRERESDSMAYSLARELGYNYAWNPKTKEYEFVKTGSKGGNKKKRRF